MARNGTGTYTRAISAYVTGTTISATEANSEAVDIGNEITNSLPRDGQAGMTGTFKVPDGSAGTPSITFSAETGSGLYRASAGVLSVAISGSQKYSLDATGLTLPGDPVNANHAATRAYVLASAVQTKADIVSQVATAFTTSGTAPNFVLTPSPAIGSYVSGQRFRVKFHTAGAGTDQLNISALGNKALKQYSSTGTKVASTIASGQLADVEYDGVDMVMIDALPPDLATPPAQIQPITASVGANALTCTLNPTALDFRSSTLSSGTVNTRTIGAAISVGVPSGATLGTVNGTQSRIVLLAIDNAGTVELAVINLAGGVNLDETTLISTTTISAGATSSNVAYSTTGRSSVPFRVVGYVESTQATAGTWASSPSTIQGIGGQALAAMSSLGFGQTWQSLAVGSTRVGGTTYYNTTGRPIGVLCILNATSGATVTVGGVQIFNLTNGSFQPVHFIVPPGYSYGSNSDSIVGRTSIGGRDAILQGRKRQGGIPGLCTVRRGSSAWIRPDHGCRGCCTSGTNA
jgi:hypothetical protein